MPSTGTFSPGLTSTSVPCDDAVDRNGQDVPVASHPRLAGHEIDQILDGEAAAGHGQMLQFLGDEHEQHDDDGRKEFGDRRRRQDGDGHGELHGHAPCHEVLEGLLEHRPAGKGEGRDADHACRSKGLQDPEPENRRSQQGHHDPGDGPRLEGSVVMHALLVARGMFLSRRMGP